MTGTPIDLDKMRSLSYISRRTRPRIREGREHPDSGKPYKATRDEAGNVVTEHGARGSGVSDRQDVDIHPATVRAEVTPETMTALRESRSVSE